LTGQWVQKVLYIEGHSLHIYSTLLKPRYVDVTGREALTNVELFVQHSIGEIVVGIPDQGVSMERIDMPIVVSAACKYASQRQGQPCCAPEQSPWVHQFLDSFVLL